MKHNIPVTKINELVEIDDAAVPQASRDFGFFYGLKQWFADAHAQFARKDYPNTKEGESEWLRHVRNSVYERVNAIRTGVGLPGTGVTLSESVVAGIQLAREMDADPELATAIRKLRDAAMAKSVKKAA